MTKKNIYIIGAGNLAREIESWLEEEIEDNPDFKLKGFLYNIKDNNPLEGYPSDFKILGNWDTFSFGKDDYCLIGIADPAWRERIYNTLKDKVKFYTFISKKAITGKFNSIGEGSVILPNCILTTNIRTGKCVFLNIGTQIGHDCVIGDFSSLMPHVNLGGNCNLGKKVFAGTGAVILPNRSIGDEASVGAGSVVIRNIKEKTSVFGNPAKKV